MTDDLQMFISLMCRKIGLQFEKNVTHDGLHSLRFVPPANAMGAHDDPNTERRNEDNECYCRKDQGFDCYKSGVLNMAPCKATPDRPDGAPIALSYPHFYQVCLSHLSVCYINMSMNVIINMLGVHIRMTIQLSVHVILKGH